MAEPPTLDGTDTISVRYDREERLWAVRRGSVLIGIVYYHRADPRDDGAFPTGWRASLYADYGLSVRATFARVASRDAGIDFIAALDAVSRAFAEEA